MQQQILHKMGNESPAYLDLQIAIRLNLKTNQQEVVAYFTKTIRHYIDKEMLVVPFNTDNH
jgi:hypothetical protein